CFPRDSDFPKLRTYSARSVTGLRKNKLHPVGPIRMKRPGENLAGRILSHYADLDAFNNDNLTVCYGLAYGFCSLIFVRIIAVERVLHGFELDNYITRPALPFHSFGGAAPSDEFCAEPLKSGLGCRDVILIALRIANIDPCDPIGFCHISSVSDCQADCISSRIACA